MLGNAVNHTCQGSRLSAASCSLSVSGAKGVLYELDWMHDRPNLEALLPCMTDRPAPCLPSDSQCRCSLDESLSARAFSKATYVYKTADILSEEVFMAVHYHI